MAPIDFGVIGNSLVNMRDISVVLSSGKSLASSCSSSKSCVVNVEYSSLEFDLWRVLHPEGEGLLFAGNQNRREDAQYKIRILFR
ncbi:hypothetical protein J6590_075489 [Homalodisca vitripennis]|nr:hypothetical protein J6590_075489 [Homalodisca vitripennis]